MDVPVPKTVPKWKQSSSEGSAGQIRANGVGYEVLTKTAMIRLFVSGAEFCRNASRAVRGAEGARTATLPSTVREVSSGAFGRRSGLKRVVLPDGLERILNSAFECSGLTEVTLPATLVEVQWDVFRHCRSLETIYVEDGFRADLSLAEVPRSAKVGPPPATVVGGTRVWDLREQKEAVIPEGTERIGNHWFYYTDVESATVPDSVREIGADAFYGCKSLKHVRLQECSALEKVGIRCFQGSALEEITIPKGVREIKEHTFYDCKSLGEVTFEEGSVLRTIGEDAFYHCSSLKRISLP